MTNNRTMIKHIFQLMQEWTGEPTKDDVEDRITEDYQDVFQVIAAGIILSMQITENRRYTNGPKKTIYLPKVAEKDLKKFCEHLDLYFETGTDGKTRDYYIRGKGSPIKDEAIIAVDLQLGEYGYDDLAAQIPIEADNED